MNDKKFVAALIKAGSGSVKRNHIVDDVARIMREVAGVLKERGYEVFLGCDGHLYSLTIKKEFSNQTVFTWKFLDDGRVRINASGFLCGEELISKKRKEIEDTIVRWFGEKEKRLICI
jgi:hypothetical protein